MTLERPLAPAAPKRLRVPLHKQQASEWCWAAVSQGVELLFEASSDLKQCQVVSRGFKQACCGADGSPVRGPQCNRPGYLHEALDALGLLARPRGKDRPPYVQGPVAFSTVQREIDRGRPVCVLIHWRDGRGHFVLIDGYSISARGTPYVFVRDPLSPASSSHHPYDVLSAQDESGGYQDGQGVWAYSFLVRSRAEAAED